MATPMEKMMDERESMTPDTGYNLVGFDDFEDPGEMLYLIGHFDTAEEAEAEKKKRLEKNPDEVMYVYSKNPT